MNERTLAFIVFGALFALMLIGYVVSARAAERHDRDRGQRIPQAPSPTRI